MKFFVADVEFSGTFDIVVEAGNETEAAFLARDEAKKRVKSPSTLGVTVYSVRESDEK